MACAFRWLRYIAPMASIVVMGLPALAVTPLHPLDLQSHANHRLNEDFAPGNYPGDRLSELRKGVQKLGGISFHLGDGLIEVAGKFLPDRPKRVNGIKVGRYIQKIHILQGARWGAYGKQGDSLGHWVADGTPIGYYEVNYADAETEAIPVVYGIDVRDWWSVWDNSKPTKRGKVVWTGSNPHLKTRPEAQHTKTPLRLYMTEWENPHPDSLVTSINMVSLNQTATPFCVAISVADARRKYDAKIQELETRFEQLRTDFQELKRQIHGKLQPQGTSKRRFFDDFDGKHSQAWSILKLNPEYISLTKRPGMLTITTEQGGIWKRFVGTKNIFLVGNPIAPGGDFFMTTRLVGFKPAANYNQAGLVCFEDKDNYLKFVLQWNDDQGGRALSCLLEEGGGNIRTHHANVNKGQDEVWLRIIKQGNRYIAAASTDGQHYRVIGAESWGNEWPAKVGLIAKNGAPQSAPQLDASFDFFEIATIDKGQDPLFSESTQKH